MTNGRKLFFLRYSPTTRLPWLFGLGVPRAFSWLVSKTYDKHQPLRAEIRP